MALLLLAALASPVLASPASASTAPGFDAASLPAALAPERQTSPETEDPAPPPDAENAGGKEGYGTRGQRSYLMQLNARARYLSVPSSVLDPWFFDSDDPGANPYDRPKVRGWAFGGEYVFDLEPGNYVIWGEYVMSLMGEGYWDDVEEPADHDDGDWVRPDGFGGFAFGASYLHEVDAIPTGPDASDVGLSFLFGAGLGLVVINGGLEEWHPGSNPDNVEADCRPSSPAYDRVDVCAADGYKRIPKVLPMVDLTASARINFSDKYHVRIDGGLHDALTLGVATGVVF